LMGEGAKAFPRKTFEPKERRRNGSDNPSRSA
jgi:hypothetical protein